MVESTAVTGGSVKPSQGAPIDADFYVLRLYVTGMTAHSARAIRNVRDFCLKHLEGHYDLQVIDVYQQPELAREEQLVAIPTLIKRLPVPLRRLVGDMSDEDRICVGLNLAPRSCAAATR